MINLLYNPAYPSNFDRQETGILSVTRSGKKVPGILYKQKGLKNFTIFQAF